MSAPYNARTATPTLNGRSEKGSHSTPAVQPVHAVTRSSTSGAILHPPPQYQACLSVSPNNMVVMSGTVRSSAGQKIEARVKVHGLPDQTHIFTGQGTVNAYLTTTDHKPSVVLSPHAQPSLIEFTFYHKKGNGYVLSKLKQDCFSPKEQFDRPGSVQLFYFRTEDSTDNDYNDSILAVNVLPDRE